MKPQLRTNALRFVILLGTLSATTSVQAQNASEPLVNLDSGPIVQLCANCSPRELRVAVTAKSGLRIEKSSTGQEDPEVIEVSFGNVRDSSLVGGFVPRWELSQDGIPKALLIGVSEKIRKAGNYDLVLSLQPKTAPAAPRLKVQMVHAASKLEVPDKLLVDRTEYWPFYTTTDKMRFDIRESSAASEVIDVGLQSRTSTLGSDMVTGQLVIDVQAPAPPSQTSGIAPQFSGAAPRPFVAAAETRELTYDLSGDFPLGVVAGSVRFFAPELTDPAILNFEVHSKLTKLYMLVAIVAGLFLSWYLKVHLHNRVELADAVSKAASLLDKVQTDWNSHHDQTFRDALTPRLTALRDAIQDRDAAAIGTEMTALDGVWRGALQDFAARIQTTQAALDEIRKATDSAWVLPATALEVLASAKNADGEIDLPDIQEQLAQSNAAAAAVAITQLRQHLAEQLRGRGTTWHENMSQYLSGLAEARAGIPAQAIAQFTESLAKSQQQLNRMNPDQLVADPPATSIVQFLRDFEGEYRIAGQLLKELGLRLAQEWTEFANVLDLSPEVAAADGPLSRLKTALDDFGRSLQQAASEPDTALQHLQDKLLELQERWRDALLGQLEPFPQLRANVNASLQRRDFLGAAQQIATARAEAHPNLALGQDEEEEEEAAEEVSWPDLAGLWPASSLSVVSSLPQLVGIPSVLSGLHFQSLQEVKAAKCLQTLLVGVLVVVYSYTFYSKTYGGTWSDISTIFFAAFAIDITLDAMLSKISPKTA
jgi:hypothetical protein